MALMSDEGMGTTMLVQPTNGGFGNNGFFGGDGFWWVILLIILLGGNGFGYGGGDMQRGFDQAALTSGISGLSNTVVNGFSNAEVAACNRAMDAMQTSYTNQIATMNQNFANQQALNAQLNGIAGSLQNCCCQNASNIESLRYNIATENCADRQAVNDAMMALSNQFNAGIQSLRDEFCADRLARKDEVIAELRSQLNERDRLASQNAQTAAIEAGQRMLASEIENYVRPQANPAYIVPNPNYCTQQYYCNGRVA